MTSVVGETGASGILWAEECESVCVGAKVDGGGWVLGNLIYALI